MYYSNKYPDNSNEYSNQNQNQYQNQNHHELRDPYKMDPYDVKMEDFRDARLYDSSIREAGWEVPRAFAIQKYKEWLRTVRSWQGMQNFRRTFKEVLQETQDDEGNVIIIKKYIPIKQNNFIPNQTNKTVKNVVFNKNVTIAQSKDKGVKITDEDFRPRLFTDKMGMEIAELRNKAGLTQAELAMKINVTANMIRNIELGGLIPYNPQDIMVKSLAKVLGVPSIKYQE